jgi:hypothetical protein
MSAPSLKVIFHLWSHVASLGGGKETGFRFGTMEVLFLLARLTGEFFALTSEPRPQGGQIGRSESRSEVHCARMPDHHVARVLKRLRPDLAQ